MISRPDGGQPSLSEVAETAIEIRSDLRRATTTDADDVQPLLRGVELTLENLANDLSSVPPPDGAEGRVAPALTALHELDGALPVTGDAAPTSVEQLQRQIETAIDDLDEGLTTAGVDVIDPETGTEIDPYRHEVYATVESTGSTGTVAAVERAGYELDGTVEMSARVTATESATSGESAASEPSPSEPSQPTASEPSPSEPSASEPSASEPSQPSPEPRDRLPIPDAIPSPSIDAVDYRELETKACLGRSAGADVYLAATPDGTEVALKVLRFQGGVEPRARERFRLVASQWATIADGDHVVTLFDAGVEPAPWLAMEVLDGGDLCQYAGSTGVPQAVWTALGIARGVAYAHENGVVHHGLTPSNVRFQKTADSWPIPKIGDWLLPKYQLHHTTAPAAFDPRYAAPEQLDGATYDHPDERTDVFQLGLLLYELFTGQPAFDGEPLAVADDVLSRSPRPPTEIRPELPDRVDEIVLGALERRMDDRPSAAWLRDELDSLLETYRNR